MCCSKEWKGRHITWGDHDLEFVVTIDTESNKTRNFPPDDD